MNLQRTISTVYQDPLELVWVSTARCFGIEVVRDPNVFASWDGVGTLRIGDPSSLDADDSLAQMILHELCHALVEGPESFRLPDWGLEITNQTQRVHEHACLRLQAALATRHDLREFFAATTNSRTYYDNLPDDPLRDDEDAAVPMALAGWQRATEGPWASELERALRVTAAIADLIRPHVAKESIWSRD